MAKQMGIDHSNVGRGHMRKPSPPTSPCDDENDDDDIEAFDTPTNTNNKKTPHRIEMPPLPEWSAKFYAELSGRGAGPAGIKQGGTDDEDGRRTSAR